MAKINNHIEIYRNSETYCSFPWAAIDGQTITVAFRQASSFSADAARKGAVTHHDRNSWIMITQSLDLGRSWRAPVRVYQSDCGVNDPALTKTKNGEFLLRVTELEVAPSAERASLKGPLVSHRAEHGRVACVRGNVIQRLDRSLKPVGKYAVEIGDATRSCSREPCVELPDGSLLLSTYRGAPQETDRVYLARSFDGGKSWGDEACILRDTQAGPSELQGINFNETSIAVLGEGELLAMARADVSFHVAEQYVPVGGVGQLYSARSYNWGLSWTRPEPTGIFGQPAHLLTLDSKRVLSTYGYRRSPFGVRARMSEDGGKTWGSEIVLRDDGLMWDLGYPMTVRTGERSFLTVYYWNDREGTRFIAGTEWEL